MIIRCALADLEVELDLDLGIEVKAIAVVLLLLCCVQECFLPCVTTFTA